MEGVEEIDPEDQEASDVGDESSGEYAATYQCLSRGAYDDAGINPRI